MDLWIFRPYTSKFLLPFLVLRGPWQYIWQYTVYSIEPSCMPPFLKPSIPGPLTPLLNKAQTPRTFVALILQFVKLAASARMRT